MKNIRFLAAVLLTLALLGGFAGCQSKTKGGEPYVNHQLIEPTGPKAIIETSKGDITVVFFPEQAPKAVENFLTHAKDGYYDGVSFHRVIEGFMVQGGSPDGSGGGGQSIWGSAFEDEFSDSLHHFPGALSMANSGTNTNGSQFFIVHNSTPVGAEAIDTLPFEWYVNMLQRELNLAVAEGKSETELATLVDSLNAQIQDAQVNGMPQEFLDRFAPALEKYAQVGGTHHLDYKHTVFGQVIAGMETVDAIAQVETDGSDKPLSDVIINKITIVE